MSNVPNTSTVFKSLIDLRGTSTTQRHLAVPSLTRCQSEDTSLGQKPIEHPVASNTEQSHDFLGDSKFEEGSYFDPRQNDFMPFDTSNFEFDEGQLNSDWLAKVLESENDDPATLARWGNSHGRN
jgi:hypothetical protein